MALSVIPSVPADLTAGEKRTLERIKELYEDFEGEAFLYVQPRIRNLEPDFLLLDPDRGVCILEVKDWAKATIKRINKTNAVLSSGAKAENPAFQTHRYHKLIQGVFESDSALFDERGEILLRVHSRVVFTRLAKPKDQDFLEVLDYHPTGLLFSDRAGDFEVEDLFGNRVESVDDELIRLARALLFPEIRLDVPPPVEDEDFLDGESEHDQLIRALDSQQEGFARAVPEGHYMISGVPGSGKTVILVARALHLAKIRPDWKILLVTYNRSLKMKLEASVLNNENHLSFMGISTANIHVKTFHSLALEVAGIGVPQDAEDSFWRETLPQAALKKARPSFDAVLVDEYQDFYEDWIRVCQKLARSHEELDERQSLFLAGDRLQSIYNPNEITWKDLGIQIQGGNRSRILKHSYRSGRAHIELALNYLMSFPNLAREVERFYEGRDGIDNNSGIKDEIQTWSGNSSQVAEEIDQLIRKGAYSADEVLVLAPNWKLAKAIFFKLSSDVKRSSVVDKEIDETKILFTTYHSAKGLERKVCIATFCDKVREPKLLYVGMTRASMSLCLHTEFDRLPDPLKTKLTEEWSPDEVPF